MALSLGRRGGRELAEAHAGRAPGKHSTTKRQLSFYAETDVDLYLTLIGTGSKTAVLNDAIRNRIIAVRLKESIRQ